ncbi:response regulator transcription factor [Fontisphaera persica]|uniref:response regulator n=1 Tax=Fontisphaera persica TaxID=2974023 RepID=UPI0024C0B796|nr:response regulator transcription factor [Fontisphaera persica]WCJ58959.1 response regulator transcription factor [Fontisphaera persica]
MLIADDHSLVRRGLRQILADAFPTAEFGEASTVPETLASLRSQPWDLLVLDINMPGRSGLDVLKEMKSANIKTPTLVISVHSEDQYALRALKAGAAGYLSKDSAPEQFLLAVERILGGRTFISPALAEKLADEMRGRRQAKSALERLSDREMEVLRLIGSGRTVKEIAGLLSLSVKTVSTYRVRLLAKLRMRTNAELMRFAIEERLVD